MLKTPNQLFSAPTTTAIFAGLLFFSASVPALASSDCSNLKGCEKKFCEIEAQLDIAVEKGNKHKADGLRKSLDGAEEHCTDKGLRKDLAEEVEKAKEDILEYKADLQEAKEDGKADKVRKYQEKIDEEQSKIEHLEEELSRLD